MTPTFNSRETYLSYRSEWKARYKEVSETIRERKWMNKERSRAWNKARLETTKHVTYTDLWNKFNEILKENPRCIYLLQKERDDKKSLEHYRSEATAMLEELKVAKKEAQRQYFASHSEEMVLA